MMRCTCRTEIDREPYGNGYAERETFVMCDRCAAEPVDIDADAEQGATAYAIAAEIEAMEAARRGVAA